jgi:hypothetical protein
MSYSHHRGQQCGCEIVKTIKTPFFGCFPEFLKSFPNLKEEQLLKIYMSIRSLEE